VATPGATGPAGPTGPTGPAGASGVGVPAGGTAGQFLSKSSNADYATGWTTLSLTGYATESWVTAGFYPLTGNPSGFITSSALTPYLLSSTAASTYQTIAGMSSYLTTSAAASTYAVIAAGQPTSGTVGQVLTKNSGTNYDSSWQTLIPGDRYLTSSTTSLTINNANKTLTIGTGLSYTPTQSITISYDASNHMHGEVLTYNSGTGVLTVDINHHTGSGTYASWVVNVGGVVPAASVAWGSITGTLGSQTDLATALNAKLATADAATTYQTLSGMSSYLSKAGNLSGLANTGTARTNLGLGTMATATATDYLSKAGNLSGLANTGTARTNLGLGTMATATATDYLSKAGNLSGLANTATARTNLLLGDTNTVAFRAVNLSEGSPDIDDTFSTLNVITSSVSYRVNGSTTSYVDDGSGAAIVSEYGSFVLDKNTFSLNRYPTYDSSNPSSATSGNELNYNAATGSLSIRSFETAGPSDQTITLAAAGVTLPSAGSITFGDATVQTTAFTTPGIPDAPSDGNYYVRKDGAWIACTVVSIYDSNSSASYNCLTV
jgi:hypothetical protein